MYKRDPCPQKMDGIYLLFAYILSCKLQMIVAFPAPTLGGLSFNFDHDRQTFFILICLHLILNLITFILHGFFLRKRFEHGKGIKKGSGTKGRITLYEVKMMRPEGQPFYLFISKHA